MVEVQISLPNYLVKYLQGLYGEKCAIDNTTELGVMVQNVLLRKSDPYYQFKSLPLIPDKKKYAFILSTRVFKTRGCMISDKDEVALMKVLDLWFRNNLYRLAVLNKQYFDINYKKTIICFFQQFGISEDDLPYHAIQKDLYRKKDRVSGIHKK